MTEPLKRPEMKIANVKVTSEDMMYFSLGIDMADFVLPSDRMDYRSDSRAVALVQAIKAGKDLSGQDFSGVNLKGADISGGKFEGANFSGACFYKTTAKNCNFADSDFTEAYLENTDFENANFTGANLKQVYARRLNLDGTQMDEAQRHKLDALEFLINQIESGKIDIRCLSKSDLLGLDLRRLDLSKVDLNGIDLSAFDLEGVNLRGAHIDPKQLMSLAGLQHYHKFVATMSEKKIQLETLKFAKENQAAMTQYAKKQLQDIDKNVYTPKAQLIRPQLKDDKVPENKPFIPPKKEETDTQEKDEMIPNAPSRVGGKIKKGPKTILKNRG